MIMIPRDPALPERRRSTDIALYHLAAIVESAEDGIISKDLNGVVTSWNRAAERIFGYSQSEMIGQTILRLIPPELAWEEDVILSRIRGGDQIRHYEAERCRKDGQRIIVSLSVSPIRDQHGTIIGAAKIVRDISEQKAAERKIEIAKDEFLSNVSHELRTPLTGIRAALRLLEHSGLDSSNARTSTLLRIANTNAERLIRLVDELLDFERLSAGLAIADLRPCRVNEIVAPALDSISPMASEQGIRLIAAIDPASEPMPLMADPDRLQQVLLNLLSNALKYSPPGGAVTLETSVDAGALLLRIRDEGRGIPQELLESVFERFQQVDTSDARQKGGVGLGLAICRKILEQHGGAIWAERNDSASPGMPGTTFSLRLPGRNQALGEAA